MGSGPIPTAAWTVAADHLPPELRPNHDKPEVTDPPFAGAPIGGFGAGTIGRTFRGEFARWHLHAGRHVYRPVPACSQLIAVHRGDALSDAFALGVDPADGTLGTWTFRTRGVRYHALYPRAWFEGSAGDGALAWRMTQLSPVLPHNYRETSLPVAWFRFALENRGKETIQVSLATSWENVSIIDPGIAPSHRCVHRLVPTDPAVLWMGRLGAEARSDEDGAFAIGAAGGRVFCVPSFDATSDGAGAWDALTSARAPRVPRAYAEGSDAPGGGRVAGLLGVRLALEAGARAEASFALAWHFPVFSFGSGRRWHRRHTRFYVRGVGRGDPDDSACRLARDALASGPRWERAIAEWQEPILSARPPALARSLFNSLYVLADGGSIWEAGEARGRNDASLPPVPPVSGARDIGRFAVLECFTYPYYATLDVRYYGSVPILLFWPELERQVLLQFATAAAAGDDEERDMLHVVERARRKRPGTLPHDLGSPDEDVWVKVNAYDDIDPNRWKDLSPKFVLLVARYLAAVGWEDRGFLRGVWPAVRLALEATRAQDLDGDGLPENEGIPDQTFDKWPMSGPSAYCSLLTIAALRAGEEIARWCGDPGAAHDWSVWRRRARAAIENLFTGETLRFDASADGERLVMAGQLSGEWSLWLAGLEPVFSPERISTILDTVLRTTRATENGRFMGLRNGGALSGEPPSNRHAREIWPGINHPIAALLVAAERVDEGLELVSALDRVVFADHPFAFVTPEAWNADGAFRGSLYMRPLSIWSVEEALRRAEPAPGLTGFLPGRADA